MNVLTHWGRVTHICVSKLTVVGSDNGLSPDRRQAIIWTNDGILSIEPLGTNFNGVLIKNHTFSFKKMHLKMLYGKWQPFCLGLNVLITAIKLDWNSVFKVWVPLYGGPIHGLNSPLPSAANMSQCIGSALIQIMACHLFRAESLSKPEICWLFGCFRLVKCIRLYWSPG